MFECEPSGKKVYCAERQRDNLTKVFFFSFFLFVKLELQNCWAPYNHRNHTQQELHVTHQRPSCVGEEEERKKNNKNNKHIFSFVVFLDGSAQSRLGYSLRKKQG